MTYKTEEAIEDLRAAIRQYEKAYKEYERQGFELGCKTILRLAYGAHERLMKLELERGLNDEQEDESDI